MDVDRSGSIDRIEWVAFLAAPKENPDQLGNTTYYDLEMRSIFDSIDINHDMSIDKEELMAFLRKEYSKVYDQLDATRKIAGDLAINQLAKEVFSELKEYNIIHPNRFNKSRTTHPDELNWQEFKNYRKVSKALKEQTGSRLQVLLNVQKNEELLKMTKRQSSSPRRSPNRSPNRSANRSANWTPAAIQPSQASQLRV